MAREYKNGDPCPVCGSTLQEQTTTETFTYKGQSFDYPDYVVYHCADCDDDYVGDTTMKKSAKAIRDFYRKVDGMLTASEIKLIRLRTGYNQDSFSKLLGGGAKSFARYENCDVVQSEPMDNLIWLIGKHPNLANDLENRHKPVTKIETKVEYHPKMVGKLVVNCG